MIAHILYLYPILKDKSIQEIIRILANFRIRITEYEARYIYYCIHAHERREYDMLRQFLKETTILYSSIISPVIRLLFKGDSEKIEVVYDIGAGHDGYARILEKIFPNSEIILIDKAKIDTKYKSFQTDIFDSIGGMKGNANFVVWMSEFLHCKSTNQKILDSDLIKKSHVFINEVNDVFIGDRLRKSGGDLYTLPPEYVSYSYFTQFNYILGYKEAPCSSSI